MTAPSAHALETRFDFGRVLVEGLGAHRLPGRHGLVFGPQAWLRDEAFAIVDVACQRPVERAEVALLSSPLWERQGLGVAAYPNVTSPEPESETLHRLRAAALAEQLRVVSAAVHRCERFLASRRTGSERLSSHPVVAQSLAKVVGDAAALTSGGAYASLRTAAGRGWLIGEIDAVAAQLVRLAGGRALLAGQAVQLRTLLLTFNRLYLEG